MLGLFSSQTHQCFWKMNYPATTPHIIASWEKDANMEVHRSPRIKISSLPTSGNAINFRYPSEMSIMLGSQPSLPGKMGSPLLKDFCLPSGHNFQTDTSLNYPPFSHVIRDMFTPQCLTPLFTMT